MTPRDRDPAVWAASYAAAYDREFAAVFASIDGPIPQERMHTALAFMARPETGEVLQTVADAAVLALHPDDGDAHDKPTPWGAAEELDLVCRWLSAAWGSRESREMNDFVSELVGDLRARKHHSSAVTSMGTHHIPTPAERLAGLEAAERAYLIAAGWTECDGDRWEQTGCEPLPRRLALAAQRHNDTSGS